MYHLVETSALRTADPGAEFLCLDDFFEFLPGVRGFRPERELLQAAAGGRYSLAVPLGSRRGRERTHSRTSDSSQNRRPLPMFGPRGNGGGKLRDLARP